MASRSLEARLLSDSAVFESEFQKAQRTIDGLRKQVGTYNETTEKVIQTERQQQSLMQRSGGILQGVQRNWMLMAGAVGAGTAALGGAVYSAKQFVNAASDQEEALNKNRVIFGDNARAIEAWANTADTSLGLSKRAALDATGTFGNLFTQLNISTGEAQKMSTSIVGLAADFASFHNADITQVIEAQTAAFRGEYDALQRFVPTINAATVNQKALEMGLGKTTKELDAQDKALATYRLIIEGAGAAQGDFARTSGELANQQRILDAQMENLRANIGSALVPAFAKATTALNEFLDEHSEEIALGIASGVDAIATALGNVKSAMDIIANSPPITLTFQFINAGNQKVPGNWEGTNIEGKSWWDVIGTTLDLFNPLTAFDTDRFDAPAFDPSPEAFERGGFVSGFEPTTIQRRYSPEAQAELDRFNRVTGNLGASPSLAQLRKNMEEAAKAEDARAKAAGASSTALTKLSEDEKRLQREREAYIREAIGVQERLQQDALTQQIEAYLEGGDALVATVRAQQEQMDTDAKRIAAGLMETFGLTLPQALETAMGHLRESAEDLVEASRRAKQMQAEALGSNRAAAIERYGAGGVGYNVGGEGFGIGGVAENADKAREAIIRMATSSGRVDQIDALLAQFEGQLQQFDTGGIVQGPMGSRQLVVAHAGETIYPDHKGGGRETRQVVFQVGGHVLADIYVSGRELAIRQGRETR